MTPNKALWVLVGLWALSFVLSFTYSLIVPPSGDPLSKGFAVLGAFLGWQGLAILFGIVALILRLTARDRLTGWARPFGFIPLAVSVILIVVLFGWQVVTAGE